jgi:RNA polymerase sigma-70 factor, ECF subfamily
MFYSYRLLQAAVVSIALSHTECQIYSARSGAGNACDRIRHFDCDFGDDMGRLTPIEPARGHPEPDDEAGDGLDSPVDGTLLARAADGDLDAFNFFVERYQQTVVILCTSILRDASLAEDVAQDTFIRAWKNLAGFKGESAKSWILRIATNRCLDLLRQRSRQATDSLDAQIVELEPLWSTQARVDAPESVAERGELADRLDSALAALPDDQRIALLMADVLGYDYVEVADLTGSALGTVKSRISRARARLRTALLADPEAREHFERYVRP